MTKTRLLASNLHHLPLNKHYIIPLTIRMTKYCIQYDLKVVIEHIKSIKKVLIRGGRFGLVGEQEPMCRMAGGWRPGFGSNRPTPHTLQQRLKHSIDQNAQL